MPRLPISPSLLVKRGKAITGLLGIAKEREPPTGPPIAQTRPAPPEATPTPAETRRGKYDDELVALVDRSPGVLVAEAAKELGVHPTALYPVIRRLETQGRMVKLGREMHPRSAAKLEQLWCEAGHSWTRPTVRGRKPKRCPAHR